MPASFTICPTTTCLQSDLFLFERGDISDRIFMDKIFADHKPQIVVNLAAQAGVRCSIANPDAYISSNIQGFYNILECCRHSYDGISERKEKSEENAEKYIFYSLWTCRKTGHVLFFGDAETASG